MSVIFKTLQKIDAGSSPSRPPQEQVLPERDESALGQDKWRRPAWVVLGVLAVIALGFGAIYGVQFLSAEVSAGNASADQKTLPESGFARQSSLQEDQYSPVRHAVPPQARFFPPDPSSGKAETSEATQEMAAQSSSEDATGTAVRQQIDQPTASEIPAAGLSDQAVVEPQVSPWMLPETIQSMPSKAESAQRRKGPAAPEELSELTAEQMLLEKRRRAALEKSARIGRLALNVEAALAQTPMDAKGTKVKLDELARLKGVDHPYVAKLEAYWLYRQEQYQPAKHILERIVAADQEDVEAGINLALIEMRTGQGQSALKRLRRLRKMHPDDGRIAELIRKVQ